MTTILILISRPEHLDKIFATLEMTEGNPKDINILAIVDGNSSLFVTARNKVEQSKFNNRLCVQYKAPDRMKNYDMMHRRQRISNIHNYAKQYVGNTDFIFSIEDDSSFNTNALKKLQHDYLIYPYAGMISGVQLGRHGITHIGGWKVNDIYEPTEIKSIEPSKGIVEVDATGLYCSMIKVDNYMKHDFKPFETELGPDFDLGFSLRQQGLMNYMDFDVPVGHMTDQGELTPKNTQIDSVTFVKNSSGRWRQKSLVE